MIHDFVAHESVGAGKMWNQKKDKSKSAWLQNNLFSRCMGLPENMTPHK
jgi:hypothetical protein